MTGSFEIRKIGVDDVAALEEVSRIDREAFGENGMAVGNLDLLTVPGEIFALQEGAAITAEAIVLGSLGTTGAFLYSLAVSRQSRNSGRGSLLLGHICEHLRSRGITHLDLTVSPKNEAAVHLYRGKFGFLRIGELTPPGHPDLARLILRKTFP